MTLAQRVSSFFLTALAVILLANSVFVYFLASSYLHHRFDEQLQSTLQTLVAAVEVEDDDVKWEPSDHAVNLGTGRDVDDIRWIVVGDAGRVVDRSKNLDSLEQADALVGIAQGNVTSSLDAADWRCLRHDLAASHPKPVEERTAWEHDRLVVIVCRQVSVLQETLNRLAGTLVVLPALCWLGAAIIGHEFCRRAIAPVREMAGNLQRIRHENSQGRLPIRGSRDELEELGIAFNELLDQVFAENERQRRFAGDAAHQLRTPLTVLQGQVEVALRRPRSLEEYQSTLQVVQEEVGRLRETVEALLFLARPADEGPWPDAQTLDFAVWLPNQLKKWESHERGPDLRCQVESGLSCRTSPGLLNQLLDVLISNALKYSSPGTQVDVRFTRRGDEHVLEVIDRGIGIAAGDRAAIFEPFFRTRDARQSGAPGIGLGLALAQRIAVSLGGRLSCDGVPPCGSRFRLSFPCFRED